MISKRQINDLARRIAREFRPERIVLFGSYAHGTPTDDSDVDLLVVMPVVGHPVDMAAEIWSKVDPPFPIDLLVRTPQELRRRIAAGDSFLREVIDRGQVLYEGAHPRVGRKGRGRLQQRRARAPSA